MAPRGETSWHGFAQAIFKQASGVKLAIQPERLHGITTSNYPTPATRPLNSRLNLGKLESALSIQLPHWQDLLALTLQEYLQ
ncbi:sugar nucleotide-binding protein [Methylotuvimicrobium buryatense]|uniref:sugar nucleotide-binding protein n=1 Tax=Methylotuvimicrobium buryatense TaxID=95641 RepID=UPI000346E1DD|nr:sugar nucleotide-binding protein [Methylotuvimicrobium buryatense]